MAVGTGPISARLMAGKSPGRVVPWFYGFFFVSGFCGLLYELVWLRMAMARFGVTTVLVSTFLSVFMAGLGLGSWAGGQLIRRARTKFPPILIYAATELLIGISAFLVPHELNLGHQLLTRLGGTLDWTSFSYSLVSGICLALSLLPWCACMGATFPVAMAALRGSNPDSQRSFSYLYLANVLGAMAGAIFPLLLIEELGFSGTLRVGALLNFAIAGCAAIRSRYASPLVEIEDAPSPQISREWHRPPNTGTRCLLFATGLTSMGMEVVWVRLFTPYLGTMVYAFAAILATYLIATFLGTKIYRRSKLALLSTNGFIWPLVGVSGLISLVAADPLLHIGHRVRLPLGVFPLAMAAGFVTPLLIDRESKGDPRAAGSAYAINVAGCILGPLIAGFLLLPHLSERWTTVLLSAPWFAVGFYAKSAQQEKGSTKHTWNRALITAGLLFAGCALVFGTHPYEAQFPIRRVMRDSSATVIAEGASRDDKHLLVNGNGMTSLTPVTKFMVHVPLALVANPHDVLVICFGMGTTHRSALSWGIHSTVVELTPSVPRLFSYFHADADQVLRSPQSRLVIDDGRRYLERSTDTYDVITVDPPPPVEAAGSSLLYSREFYALAKQRLRAGGILQQWLPGGDPIDKVAALRAITDSFPYVRMFRGVTHFGIHFFASMTPIPAKSASELANRLPSKAALDFLEWGPAATVEGQFDQLLRGEIPISAVIALSPQTPALQDDQPVNEYVLLRHLFPNKN